MPAVIRPAGGNVKSPSPRISEDLSQGLRFLRIGSDFFK